MRRSIVLFFFALVLSTGAYLPEAAQAYLLRVDFTVETTQFQEWDGYLTFDCSVIPTGGGTVWHPTKSSLAFLYAGTAWDFHNAEVSALNFDADGSLRDWNINSLYYYDAGYDGPRLDILGFMSGIGGELQYWDGSIPMMDFGNVKNWTVTSVVPEPGMLALLGVAPLFMLRRRES